MLQKGLWLVAGGRLAGSRHLDLKITGIGLKLDRRIPGRPQNMFQELFTTVFTL